MKVSQEEMLQRQLELSCGEVPIPLSNYEAIKHAYELRKRGMTYSAICIAMGVYHGQWWGESRWRHQCRLQGAPVRRGAYRGRPGMPS